MATALQFPALTPAAYIESARVPDTLEPQQFGLWTIRRVSVADNTPIFRKWAGFDSMTMLYRFTTATMHTTWGEVVMEDSLRELRRHLPIWLHARGRVLVTGLGLGCVVRGLLANPEVEHITVVELDPKIGNYILNSLEGGERWSSTSRDFCLTKKGTGLP